MWTIRPEQSQAFEQHHLKKFEDEMVEHLGKFSPYFCKTAGEPAVREVIRMGVENAKTYGFTSRGPVRFYIELMFMFGSYFDSDPQCSWAKGVLNSAAALDEAGRSDRLYYRLRDYMLEVCGVSQEHTVAALHRASEVHLGDFISSQGNLEESVLSGLHSIYPQKYEYVGASVIRRLVTYSFELADRFALSKPEGKGIMAVTIFMCGHRSFTDRLFPWISTTLHDRTASDPVLRHERLLRGVTLFFRDLTPEGRKAQ